MYVLVSVYCTYVRVYVSMPIRSCALLCLRGHAGALRGPRGR